jgi:hypothetical protein
VVSVFQLCPSRRSHIADATIAALTSHKGSVYYIDLSLNGGLGSQIGAREPLEIKRRSRPFCFFDGGRWQIFTNNGLAEALKADTMKGEAEAMPIISS